MQAAVMEDLPYRLLLACENGNFNAVTFLVEVWGADVNAADNYYRRCGYSYLKIEGATPLFVASLVGHSEIVRYLISKAANVSATTHTEDYTGYGGLTPLHGAFKEGRPEKSFSEQCAESSIIAHLLLAAGANPSTLTSDGKPVWMGLFCGYDATIALVNRELDVNQRNRKGETILHWWCQNDHHDVTEKDRVNVVRLLLDRGANLQAQDCAGLTPIFTSVHNKFFDVFDLLIKQDVLDRNLKIDALELAGSYLVTNSENQERFYSYWRQAVRLREESPPIKKIPLQMRSGRTVEWTTSDDLEKVIKKPSEHFIHCMLTRLRIYSRMSYKAVDHFMSDYFSDDDYSPNVDGRRRQDVVTILFAVLETIYRFYPDEPRHWSLPNLVEELFECLEPDDPFFNQENFAESMRVIIAVSPDKRLTPPYSFYRILANLPVTLLHEDIRNYLSLSNDQDDEFLASACHAEDWKFLRLLLHLGANPNRAVYKNLPLHIVASRGEEHPMVLEGKLEREQISLETEYTAAHLLFDYGANPYAINKEGKTAVDLWMEKNCGGKGTQSEAWKNRPYWCRESVPKLVCLAAKTIHIHGIPYSDPGAVPVDCLPVVKKH